MGVTSRLHHWGRTQDCLGSDAVCLMRPGVGWMGCCPSADAEGRSPASQSDPENAYAPHFSFSLSLLHSQLPLPGCLTGTSSFPERLWSSRSDEARVFLAGVLHIRFPPPKTGKAKSSSNSFDLRGSESGRIKHTETEVLHFHPEFPIGHWLSGQKQSNV